MDNNQTWRIGGKKAEEMENWKKQIIMDPILNTLFDPSTTAQQFLNARIMPLPHAQAAGLYSKLSSINFELMENLKKEVENKSSFIEKSYHELIAYKDELDQQGKEDVSDSKSNEYLSHLRAFNKKYETVQSSLTLWKNITDCLQFSKAYQNFKVNTNIIKTRMRGYNGNEDTINCFNIAKMVKEIIDLSNQFDFNGMKGFENQRVFISSTKSIVHAIACKTLPRLLLQSVNLIGQGQKSQREQVEKAIEQWVHVFANIGTLRDFVINYGKSIMRDIPENVKKNIKGDLPNFTSNIENVLMPYLTQTCKAIILLEEKLVMMRKIELSNIPNLFVCIWEKLCTSAKENIAAVKKEQESKNIPKTREQNIVWKYPVLFNSFTKLCSHVQMYLVDNTLYNSYHFGKNKERLVISSLLELGIQYHQEKDRQLSEMSKLFNAKKAQQQDLQQYKLQQNTKNVQQFAGIVDLLLKQSRCQEIYNSILNALCSRVSQIEKETIGKAGEGQREQYIIIVNLLKKQLKPIIIKYGQGYGITKEQLQAFKLAT